MVQQLAKWILYLIKEDENKIKDENEDKNQNKDVNEIKLKVEMTVILIFKS